MVRLRKWKFNEQLLQETICIGKYYLEHNDLTSQEKAEIKSDISRFKRFINGDFETTSTYRHLSLPMIKKSVLASMKKYRRLFNREFREWLINLQQSNIFRYGQYIPRFKLSIDTMADETLTLYGNQAPHFFLQAEALLSEKISLIHYTKTDSSSFCFYSSLLDLPMIIINSKDDASVLTHEIQHGIEYLKDIPTHIFYHELGPIYFELIFSDQTFKSYGKKALATPLERIQDTEDFLKILKVYVYCLSVFEKFDFDIDDELFLNTFSDISGIYGEELLELLTEEFTNPEISESLGYLFSFLKAIEIRDMLKQNDLNGILIFNQLLFSKKFKFVPPPTLEPYKRFVKEMKQKVK